jgi:hypothetical protein
MARERERRRRANGEGSIYQRASDGLWVGMAYPGFLRWSQHRRE